MPYLWETPRAWVLPLPEAPRPGWLRCPGSVVRLWVPHPHQRQDFTQVPISREPQFFCQKRKNAAFHQIKYGTPTKVKEQCLLPKVFGVCWGMGTLLNRMEGSSARDTRIPLLVRKQPAWSMGHLCGPYMLVKNAGSWTSPRSFDSKSLWAGHRHAHQPLLQRALNEQLQMKGWWRWGNVRTERPCPLRPRSRSIKRKLEQLD